MKQIQILKKNLKVIFRNRSSAFVLLAGPILLIILVAIFFSGESDYDLSVGYYSQNKEGLTAEFVTALEKSEFVVKEFESEEACVEKLKQSVIHTCIIFPVDFQITNAKAADLRFIVDYSRINLVYKIIDSVSGLVEVEEQEVSYTLTTVLLNNINSTINDLKNYESQQQKMIDEVNGLKNTLDSAISGSGKLDFDYSSLDVDGLRKNMKTINTTFRSLSADIDKLDLIADEVYDDLGNYINDSDYVQKGSDLIKLNETIPVLQNQSITKILVVMEDIELLDASIQRLSASMEVNAAINEQVIADLNTAKETASSLSRELSDLQRSTQNTRKKLEAIGITNAQTVVSPINTQIEPLVLDSTNAQSTFPFLLVLIIMLASLTLSSTLVIFEKKSRSVFRNFMAPVRQSEFTLATFTTIVLLMISQSIVILFASNYLTNTNVLSNFGTVFAIVIVATIFFTVLGMIIGRSFSSQEGAVMGSIVVGCLLLFLSNLVVPLESIAPAFSSIIKYNPFIIFSELLRQAFLFELTTGDALMKLFVLLWIALCALGTIILMDRPRKGKIHTPKSN